MAALPRARQNQIRQRLADMVEDPFQGDVRPLRGQWQGLYRLRVGRYRIIFQADTSQHIVDIVAILSRDNRTYT
jgi:mRNA-degrading endonuclease RelE of RelBE toxin-antitoxin system